MKYQIIIAILTCVCATFTAVAENVGQLPLGYYVPAKMPMTIVHPRSDNETPTWARHRKAYADGTVEYRVPLAIQGGAYPFIYEIVTAPTGMTIGNDLRTKNYGVVAWTPGTTGGPYNVSVKVTDQEQKTITVDWTVTATTDGFIFVDPNAEVSGTGSKSSPLKLFSDIHQNSRADTKYSGQIVYLRGGTHILSGPESTGNLQIQDNNKPAIWLGYPGETVSVDFSQSKILIDNQNDVYVSDLRITSARTDVNNAHFFFFNQNAAQKRATFFEVDFDNIGRGLKGNDNPAALTFFNPGALRNYITVMGCTLKDYSAPLMDGYAMKYGVVENNTLYKGKNATINQGIFLKSDIQNFSIRRNTSREQSFTYGAIETMLQAQLFTNAEIEISHNFLSDPVNTNSVRALVYNWAGGNGKNSNANIYVYRNTLLGNIQGLNLIYTVDIEKNVVVSPKGIQSTSTERIVNNIDNLSAGVGSDLTDANGNLIGASAKYHGTHGHVISTGTIPPRSPTNLKVK